MVTSISQKLLVAALTISALACSQVAAMKRLVGEISDDNKSRKKLKTQAVNNIILRISPNKTFYTFPDNKVKIMTTTLEGFKSDQVMLEENSLSQDNTQSSYAIERHKKLNYLNDNDKLIILRHDSDKDDYVEVSLDETIKDRILKYLCHDTEDTNRNCFNFVNEVVFNRLGENKPVFEHNQLLSKKSLKSGDPIVLLDYSERALHYGLCIDQNIVISKCGFGSPLLVTTINAINQFYESEQVALLSPISLIRFHEFLPEAANACILSHFCNHFDQNDEKGILNLIHFLRKAFRLLLKETVPLVKSHLERNNLFLYNNTVNPSFIVWDKKTWKKNILHFAIDDANVDSIQIICILAQNDLFGLLQDQDHRGNTAYHQASCSEDAKAIEVFFHAASAKGFAHDLLKLRDSDQNTGLIMSVFYSKLTQAKSILEQITKHSVNPISLLAMQDSGGNTALHYAKSGTFIRLILEAATDKAYELVFIQNKIEQTPLHRAVEFGECVLENVTLLLLAAGDSCKKLALMKDSDGKVAFDYILERKKWIKQDDYQKIESLFEHLEKPMPDNMIITKEFHK